MDRRSGRRERGIGRGGGGGMDNRILNDRHESSSRRRQLTYTYREGPPKDGNHWSHGDMPAANTTTDDYGVGSRGGGRRRLDGGGWVDGGNSRGGFRGGSRGSGSHGGMRHMGSRGNSVGPDRGRRLSSPPRDWNRDGGGDSRDMPRPVLIEPNNRGWDRASPRNGYRNGGPDDRGLERDISRYANGVEGDGGWGSGGGGSYRDDSRNRPPPSRYPADIQQGRLMTHVVSRESWDQSHSRFPSRDRGGGQWHGTMQHGPPHSGLNQHDSHNRMSQREESRHASLRHAWNGDPVSLLHPNQHPLDGPPRDRIRRPDRSRTRSKGRPGGGGGYRDSSNDKSRFGFGRGSRPSGRTPLRRSPVIRQPRSRGRSPGRARRGYAGGGGGGDFTPQKFGGDFRNGGGRERGYDNGVGGYAKYAAMSRRSDGRRNGGRSRDWGAGRSGGVGRGKEGGRQHGRSSSWKRGDSAASDRRNGGGDHSGSGDDQGHYKGKEGDLVGDRYELRADVGLGTFGRVVECWDTKRCRRVAVKIVRKVKKYHESALIEAQILRDVNDREREERRGRDEASLCVEMFGHFEHQGHCCLVFECLGLSLYEYLKKNEYRGFPMEILRPISRELLQAIEFLHSIKLIHTDLKPENVLLTSWEDRDVKLESGDVIRVPSNPHIKVIDFGGATYEHDSHASIVNTRQYRAPEVILGMRWLYPSDLWSIGCIIAELFLGDLLFATHNNLEHLALMEKCVGPFPSAMMAKAPRTADFFDESTGECKGAKECDLENRRHIRRMKRLQDITAPVDSTGMGNLLEKLLTLDPKRRATATEALRHRFFEM